MFVQWDNSRENEVSIGNSPNCAHSSNNRIGERFSVNSATYQWFTFEIWSGSTIAEHTVQSIYDMRVNPPMSFSYAAFLVIYYIQEEKTVGHRRIGQVDFLCLSTISKRVLAVFNISNILE